MNNKKYITTPIYYVNDKPHIGHAYSTIVADVLARYWRAQIEPSKVFFLTGTDEHGAKISAAAKAMSLLEKDFADQVSQKYRNTWRELNLSHDYFIRTTDSEHEKIVSGLIQKLYNSDNIYKGNYEGKYCVACEEYKQTSDLLDGKICVIHKKAVEIVNEEVYFFRLSKYQLAVEDLIESDKLKIFPEARKREVLRFIKSGLRDVAISRSNVAWGIKLPWEKEHTLYVWIDALFNYFSAPQMLRKNIFPPDEQIIGKDILRFHAVIWPALLMALKLPLPKQLIVNGYFTVDGEKMGKTRGNVIDPLKITSVWGNDALRYYLLRDLSFGEDGDFSHARFKQRYESELSNGLGNLVQRVISMINKYSVKIDFLASKSALANIKIESYDFSGALDEIWEKISQANAKVDREKPWIIAKENKNEKLSLLLNELYGDIKSIALLLEPLLPETSQKIFSQLKSLEPSPIFPRIGDE